MLQQHVLTMSFLTDYVIFRNDYLLYNKSYPDWFIDLETKVAKVSRIVVVTECFQQLITTALP